MRKGQIPLKRVLIKAVEGSEMKTVQMGPSWGLIIIRIAQNGKTRHMQVDTQELSLNDSGRHERSQLQGLKIEEYSIQQFLNEEAFVDNYNPKRQKQIPEEQQKCPTYATQPDHLSVDETPKKTKRKSIFHNFQKHLITLLKKHFRIGLKTFQGREESQLAFALWQAFTKTKSYNKKILHIIFGIQDSPQANSQYQSLTHEFKEFRSLRNKHCIYSIVKAQELIRLEIIQQSKSINKLLLEANCNVSRLELFWEYFNSFILELGQGPMVKRMTKEQKGRLIQQFAVKRKEN